LGLHNAGTEINSNIVNIAPAIWQLRAKNTVAIP
jgi:hypothetical protein